MISWKAAILESNMVAISGVITAYLKIQDGGQTKELKEHRIYMNLKSYASETLYCVTILITNSYTFYIANVICNVVAAIIIHFILLMICNVVSATRYIFCIGGAKVRKMSKFLCAQISI